MAIRNVFVHQGDRDQVAFIAQIPELWQSPGTVLYVGAGPRRFHCGPELCAYGHEITVLEVWPPNATAFLGCLEVTHIVRGDVGHVDLLHLPHPTYDIAFWWHGPEHVPLADVGPTLAKLETLTQRIVVLGCPWGVYRMANFPNPYEAHLCELYPEDLERWGYTVHAIGHADDPETGRLVAWKVTTHA